MKSLFIVFLFILPQSFAQAASLDGNYKMSEWTCQDGSQPATADVVSRWVDSTYLKIIKDQMITTLKFEGACEVNWTGTFTITDHSLNLSEMIGQASAACHYSPNDKEPAITFTLQTKKGELTLIHDPSITDTCATGSVRTYKQIKEFSQTAKAAAFGRPGQR